MFKLNGFLLIFLFFSTFFNHRNNENLQLLKKKIKHFFIPSHFMPKLKSLWTNASRKMGHLCVKNAICSLHKSDDRGNRFKFNVIVQCVAFLFECCLLRCNCWIVVLCMQSCTWLRWCASSWFPRQHVTGWTRMSWKHTGKPYTDIENC